MLGNYDLELYSACQRYEDDLCHTLANKSFFLYNNAALTDLEMVSYILSTGSLSWLHPTGWQIAQRLFKVIIVLTQDAGQGGQFTATHQSVLCLCIVMVTDDISYNVMINFNNGQEITVLIK